MTDLILPEYVKVCPLCDGTGKTRQMFTAGCGGGYYHSMSRCEMCGKGMKDSAAYYDRGMGFIYKDSGVPVGASVIAQIETLNGGLNGTSD